MENENQTLEESPEETSQEETPEETPEETVETSTPKNVETVDWEAKFKASQTESIRLKKENDGLKTKPVSKSEVNIDDIIEAQQATKGLDRMEISELRLRAKANSVALTEARKDSNFELWSNAYREKVEKDKQTLKPSSKQGLGEAEKPLKDMTSDEKNEYFAKRGFVKEFPRAKPL